MHVCIYLYMCMSLVVKYESCPWEEPTPPLIRPSATQRRVAVQNSAPAATAARGAAHIVTHHPPVILHTQAECCPDSSNLVASSHNKL